MKQYFSLFLLVGILSGCNGLFNSFESEYKNAIEPAQLDLQMGVEISQLRIDIIRQINNDLQIDEKLHHLGFYLSEGIFADLNGNISLSVVCIFDLQPTDDYEIEHELFNVTPQKRILVEKQADTIIGWNISTQPEMIFTAQIYGDDIRMDHRDLYPYRTFYLRDNRISERLQGYFFDVSLIRIRKEEQGFVAPSLIVDKNYYQLKTNEISLSNKTCKVIRSDKFIDINDSNFGKIKVITLSSGYVIEYKHSSTKTVSIFPNRIEIYEGDLLIESFTLISN